MSEGVSESDMRAAVRQILGNGLAQSIADDMGWHWAIAAATADPHGDNYPQAQDTISRWIEQQPSLSARKP